MRDSGIPFVAAAVSLAVALAVSACSKSDPFGVANGLRVKLVNAEARNMTVVMDGPRFDPGTVYLAPNEDRNVHPPGVAGDVLTFDVTSQGLRGWGSCRASATIAPGSSSGEYGQVTFYLDGTGGIGVECSSGWS